MEIAGHAALSRTYITASVWLEEMGIHQLAAEAVWGAANQAVAAVRHTRGHRHGNARDKERFVIDLGAAGAGQPGFASGVASQSSRANCTTIFTRTGCPLPKRRVFGARPYICGADARNRRIPQPPD